MIKSTTVFTILFLAFFSFSFFEQSPTQASYQNGKNIYATYCQSCHMEDGNGVESVYPTLVKTGSLANKNRLVKIILQGMRGKIVVKGVNYDTEMAAVSLTDKETADLVNYIRNAWGNKAAYIRVADVVAAKKAVVKGFQPF